MKIKKQGDEPKISFYDFKKKVIEDYKIAVLSRECSYLGRREVFSGKGNFGIFGDGKELPQLAMNHFFENGDFRSGYYRDQTLLFAQGLLTVENVFAALYADLDLEREPMSGGRQMGGHFVTASRDKEGNWLKIVDQKNHSGDISPTGSQMPRLLGLAQASKIYRNLSTHNDALFSKKGNEIAWGTIGNASTSEGMFFETLNAAGVMQVPMVISVWDDEYGISVSNKDHTVKESISEALKGFQRTEEASGFEIITVKGWDYLALIEAYQFASKVAREDHVPVLVHVTELTQPLGHSSSGSHERYKSKERLGWEKAHDCNDKMRAWIISEGFAQESEITQIEADAKKSVKISRIKAWSAYNEPILKEKEQLLCFFNILKKSTHNDTQIQVIFSNLEKVIDLGYKDIISAGRQIKIVLSNYPNANIQDFQNWLTKLTSYLSERISSHLYSLSKEDLLAFNATPAIFNDNSAPVDGRIIIRDNFEALLKKHDNLLIFGEDVGKIGDVNQGLEGLQAKFGDLRIADTGIRETTIAGQGIGMALRGLRPIAEIQYLDYILYCIQILSDDLASMNYRTIGQQIAPLIIRTRGHRLEGIWHSGSPMGGMIHLLRGMHILVPRNMTQAAGFYNTLLQIEQPAIVVEPLNGYRLKETPPSNLGEFSLNLGKVDVLTEGNDVTVVSYGSTLRIVEASTKRLLHAGIHIEIIDIQSLIPFDLNEDIRDSIAKTSRLLIVDEDVPGGASAYILQQLIEKQNIFSLLDSAPKLLAAKSHRPAYGGDGDYFSKPSEDDIFEALYSIMHEANPKKFSL
ncbi:MAG: 2-oxoisovalerate dehydrogenase E1 component [Flavobacteriaceae bacterium]|jgi:2-oxoisovalerate dehydrogenase E1 component